MTTPQLGVRIGADLADIKSALGTLRGDLQKLKADGNKALPDTKKFAGGLLDIRKNLGGVIAGLGGLATIAAGLRTIVKNTIDAAREQAQLAAVLKSTGGVAGQTQGELNKMADGLQQVSTFAAGNITEMQSLLLTFTQIRGDVFPKAQQAVLDMAQALGTDLSSAAMLVGKALNDPIKGVSALSRSGVQFTEAQREVINTLVETGRTAEAQTIILAELETQFGGSARAARDTLGGALTVLKNNLNDVLEGDSQDGGIRGLTQSINQLAQTMTDPAIKSGFAVVISGLVSMVKFAVEGTAAIGGLANALFDTFRADADKSYQGLLTKWQTLENQIVSLEKRGATAVGPFEANAGQTLESLKQEQAAIDRLIKSHQSLRTAQETGGSSGSPNGRGRGFRTLGTDGSQIAAENTAKAAKEAAKAADAAAAEAKRKVEALRRETDKLREEALKAADARKKELDQIRDRAAAGLRDVEIALQRASGDEAGAAFKEIEDKYAQLIADLTAMGDVRGIEMVNKLINIEQVDARLADFKSKMQAITSELRATETSLGAQAGGGLLAPAEAERQIDAVRATSLQRLQDLRTAVQAYYEATKDPSVLAYLQELDGTIGQVQQTQNTWASKVEDQIANSLGGFFNDLISGAKSFKDAFRDMVRNFLQGIAQMIAQQLALNAAKAAMRAFGFHSGGLVGAGGATFTRSVSPMLFGMAPRYHSGGIAGLGPDEVPAILQRGEEVLTRRDPRHRGNGGMSGGSETPIRNIVVFGEDQLADALAGAAGERVIITHARNNRQAISSD